MAGHETPHETIDLTQAASSNLVPPIDSSKASSSLSNVAVSPQRADHTVEARPIFESSAFLRQPVHGRASSAHLTLPSHTILKDRFEPARARSLEVTSMAPIDLTKEDDSYPVRSRLSSGSRAHTPVSMNHRVNGHASPWLSGSRMASPLSDRNASSIRAQTQVPAPLPETHQLQSGGTQNKEVDSKHININKEHQNSSNRLQINGFQSPAPRKPVDDTKSGSESDGSNGTIEILSAPLLPRYRPHQPPKKAEITPEPRQTKTAFARKQADPPEQVKSLNEVSTPSSRQPTDETRRSETSNTPSSVNMSHEPLSTHPNVTIEPTTVVQSSAPETTTGKGLSQVPDNHSTASGSERYTGNHVSSKETRLHSPNQTIYSTKDLVDIERVSSQARGQGTKVDSTNEHISVKIEDQRDPLSSTQGLAETEINNSKAPARDAILAVTPQPTTPRDSTAIKMNDPDKLDLSTLEVIVRKHLSHVEKDHAAFVKPLLRHTREAIQERTKVVEETLSENQTASSLNTSNASEKVSAIAGMQSIDVAALPRALDTSSPVAQVNLQVFKPSGGKPNSRYMSVPVTIYKAGGVEVPTYTDYVFLTRNVLAEDDPTMSYWPYFGDEPRDEDPEGFEENYVVRIKELPIVHWETEYGKKLRPYAERFLNEAGCRIADVFRWLLDDPRCLPWNVSPTSTGAWLKKNGYLPDKFDRKDENWMRVLKSLPPSDDEALSLAGLVSKAFLRATELSLWHVIKQVDVLSSSANASRQPQATPTKALTSPTVDRPLFYANDTYTSIGCLICFAHSCPGHAPVFSDLGLGPNGDIGNEFVHKLLLKNQPSAFKDDEFCSEDCFWKNSEEAPGRTHWSTAELELLKAMEPIFLHERRGSCVAQLSMTKTCKEIQKRAVELMPSISMRWAEPAVRKVEATKSTISNKSSSKPTYRWFWEHAPNTNLHHERKIFQPCSHEGPCVKGVCSCVDRKIACEKTCMCPSNCDRRYRGCSCHQGTNKVCWQNKKCDCFQLNRECDPDLCGTCGACEVLDPVNRYNDAIHHGRCSNVAIQRGVPKRTLTAQSFIKGYGIFVGEPVKADDFIGEYKGEIISKAESERRDWVYRQRQTQYLFTLNAGQDIDSTRAGNKMRFVNCSINHCNAYSKVLFCDMVQRIGIFAQRDIGVGEEIYFDYNYSRECLSEFWEKDGQPFGANKNDRPANKRPRTGAVKERTGKKGGARPGAGRKPNKHKRNSQGLARTLANINKGIPAAEDSLLSQAPTTVPLPPVHETSSSAAVASTSVTPAESSIDVAMTTTIKAGPSSEEESDVLSIPSAVDSEEDYEEPPQSDDDWSDEYEEGGGGSHRPSLNRRRSSQKKRKRAIQDI